MLSFERKIPGSIAALGQFAFQALYQLARGQSCTDFLVPWATYAKTSKELAAESLRDGIIWLPCDSLDYFILAS
jgi:hypothetical protein